ncbi:MAG: tetratricopeptide repeat protein [Proteobacteria bacterium]|nr:tetratricopeptide repeat protein [Pseudomonadota bacterium]
MFLYVMKILSLTLTLGLVTGCIAFRSLQQLGEDVFDIQIRLESMENEVDSITATSENNQRYSEQLGKKSLASINSQLQRLETELSVLSGKVDRLSKFSGADQHKNRTIDSSLKSDLMQLEQDLVKLKDSVALSFRSLEDKIGAAKLKNQVKTSSAAKNKAPKQPEKKSLPPTSKDVVLTTLAEAREAFQQKKYVHLTHNMNGLMVRMSLASHKEELMYYHCESLYKLGSLESAVVECDKLLKSEPSENRFISRAKLRIGDSYRHLNNYEVAVIYYDEVIQEFPGSDDASKALARKQDILAKR